MQPREGAAGAACGPSTVWAHYGALPTQSTCRGHACLVPVFPKRAPKTTRACARAFNSQVTPSAAGAATTTLGNNTQYTLAAAGLARVQASWSFPVSVTTGNFATITMQLSGTQVAQGARRAPHDQLPFLSRHRDTACAQRVLSFTSGGAISGK